MVTKWDLITDADRDALDRTPFTDSAGNPGACAGCGEALPTEGAFARHFVLTDRRYLNLGWCPDAQREPLRGVQVDLPAGYRVAPAVVDGVAWWRADLADILAAMFGESPAAARCYLDGCDCDSGAVYGVQVDGEAGR